MYTIGQLAELSGVSAKALRIYEERGLLYPERDPENQYRVYGDKEKLALQKIVMLQFLGFSLEKIKAFLDESESADLEESFFETKATAFCIAAGRGRYSVASRVIHYIVGQKVTERIHLQDRERFLFGNLLPDCVDSPAGRKGAKASSHFWEMDSRREARGQNWHLFWNKYERYRKDELYLGYMCHLVTDAIWLSDVIVPLKEANGGCHFRTTEILYRDYHRLNELLKQDFPTEFLLIKWLENEIEEADSAFWETYYQGLLDEWQEDTGAGKEDLELVDYDRICDFIREAVNVAAEEIEAKRENRPGRDPASFYAPNRLFDKK